MEIKDDATVVNDLLVYAEEEEFNNLISQITSLKRTEIEELDELISFLEEPDAYLALRRSCWPVFFGCEHPTFNISFDWDYTNNLWDVSLNLNSSEYDLADLKYTETKFMAPDLAKYLKETWEKSPVLGDSLTGVDFYYIFKKAFEEWFVG